MAGFKAPKVSGKLGTAVPGNASRARVNEASGVKVTNTPGAPVGVSKAISGDTGMVMPVDHPAAKTTRKVMTGGAL